MKARRDPALAPTHLCQLYGHLKADQNDLDASENENLAADVRNVALVQGMHEALVKAWVIAGKKCHLFATVASE